MSYGITMFIKRMKRKCQIRSCFVVFIAGVLTCYDLSAETSPPSFREISMATPTGNFAAVAMGDIDKDGYAEILSGCRDKQQGLFLFSYKNSRWTRKQITAKGQYGGVALADVTGDGVLDVLAVKNGSKDTGKGLEIFASILQNKSAGFKALKSPLSDTTCDDLAVGDIEQDGDLDIALATGGEGVKILLNNGNASSFTILSLATDTYEDTAIALGDLNADKRLDVVVTNHPGKNPRVFLCSSSGAVSYSTAYVDGLNIPPTIGYKTGVADFNADGHADLAIGTRAGLKLFLGSGCVGAESKWWRQVKIAQSSETMQVCIGDINQDGKADIASSSASGILVLLNSGAEKFKRQLDVGLTQKGEYSGCCLFDFDGDGDLDIACSSFQGLGIRFFENLLVR
jgi:hypothetical protein